MKENQLATANKYGEASSMLENVLFLCPGYKNANGLLPQWKKKGSDDAEIKKILNEGNVLFDKKEYTQAYKIFKRIIMEFDKDHPIANEKLCKSIFELGNISLKQARYEEVLNICKNFSLQGNICQECSDIIKTAENLKDCSKHMTIGDRYYENKNTNGALSEYENVWGKCPNTEIKEKLEKKLTRMERDLTVLKGAKEGSKRKRIK